MDTETQGRRLQIARAHAGFEKPQDAVRQFRWNTNTYKSHENDIRGLKPKVAAKYAKAFRCEASWLLTGEGSPPGSAKVALDRERLRSVIELAVEANRTVGAGLPADAIARMGESLYEKMGQSPLSSADAWKLMKDLIEGAKLLSAPPPAPATRRALKS